MVVGGALERAGFDGFGTRFTVKGGVALELRLRHMARATRDLDLIFNGEEGDPVAELEAALAAPYQGFAFRRKGAPEQMPNGAARVAIALAFEGKPWGTVQVDVARQEGDSAEVEMVDSISLAPFGLENPAALPCLSLPYHIAQKIHAMTFVPEGGRRNERFRDLVDLILLQGWVTDLESVRTACRHVFATRGTHPWPPFFTLPEHWAEPFARMAADLKLDTLDGYDAAIFARQFISTIDESAEWVEDVDSLAGMSATTWYFAVSSGGELRRITARVGEAFFVGGGVAVVAGDVAIIGVVIFLRDRKPILVEGVSVARVVPTAEPVSLKPEIWGKLAREIIRLSKAPVRAIQAFGVYLSHMHCTLPCVIAYELGVSVSQGHWYRIHYVLERFLWDLEHSQPVRGATIGRDRAPRYPNVPE
jgi:hypothetical protein